MNFISKFHFPKTNTNGKKKKRLSTKEGTNSAKFSADFTYYINTFSSATTPSEYSLHLAKNGKLVKEIKNNTRQEIKIPVDKVTCPGGYKECKGYKSKRGQMCAICTNTKKFEEEVKRRGNLDFVLDNIVDKKNKINFKFCGSALGVSDVCARKWIKKFIRREYEPEKEKNKKIYAKLKATVRI